MRFAIFLISSLLISTFAIAGDWSSPTSEPSTQEAKRQLTKVIGTDSQPYNWSSGLNKGLLTKHPAPKVKIKSGSLIEKPNLSAFVDRFNKISKVSRISPSVIAVELSDGASFFITSDGKYILGNIIVDVTKRGYVKSVDVISKGSIPVRETNDEAKKETIDVFKLKGWRVAGDSPSMVLFFDPKCPYCHKLIKKLDEANLKIPYLAVPVAIIRGSKAVNVAKILDLSWPNAVASMNSKNLSGGITELEAKDKISYNTKSYWTLGKKSVPIIMLRDGFVIDNPLGYSIRGLKDIVEEHDKK